LETKRIVESLHLAKLVDILKTHLRMVTLLMVLILKFSLLSASQLCDKGNKVILKSTQCDVFSLKIRKITLSSSKVENVYAINLYLIDSKNLSCFKVVNDDVWLWHTRLGHASLHISEKLSEHDLVRSLSRHKYDDDEVCSACVRGKQVRASFKPIKIF